MKYLFLLKNFRVHSLRSRTVLFRKCNHYEFTLKYRPLNLCSSHYDTCGVDIHHVPLVSQLIADISSQDTPVESTLNEFCDSCASQLPKCSDEEISKLLDCFVTLHRSKIDLRDFDFGRRLLFAFDKRCANRIFSWSNKFFIQILSDFPHIYMRPSRFVFKAFKRFNKVIDYPLEDYLCFLNVMNRLYFWNVYYSNIYECEYRLIKELDIMTLEQVSIVLKTVNLTKSKIVDVQLKTRLMDKLCNEINLADDVILETFLWFFCMQAGYHKSLKPVVGQALKLVECVQNVLDQHNFSCLSTTAILTSRFRIYSPEILADLEKKLIEEFENISITFLEQSLYALTFFNAISEVGAAEILHKLRHSDVIAFFILKHPKRYVRCIVNLIKVNIYPHDLINTILSTEFLMNTYSKKLSVFSLPKDVFFIDSSVRIEFPDYKGNLLDVKLTENMAKYHCWYIPKSLKADDLRKEMHHFGFEEPLNASLDDQNKQKDIENAVFVDSDSKLITANYNYAMRDVRRVLNNKFGGEEFTHLCYVLPHIPRPNLIFGLDAALSPALISESIRNEIKLDMNQLDSDIDWWAVIITNYTYGSSINSFPLSFEIPKKRQLEKLNFKLVIVNADEWFDLKEQDKLNLLEEKIK